MENECKNCALYHVPVNKQSFGKGCLACRDQCYFQPKKEKTMTKEEALEAGAEWMKETVDAGRSATVEEFCGRVRCLKHVEGRLTVMREFPYTVPRPIPQEGRCVANLNFPGMTGVSTGRMDPVNKGLMVSVIAVNGCRRETTFIDWAELEVKK